MPQFSVVQKTSILFLVAVFVSTACLTGCAPDLVVSDLNVTWNDTEKKAIAEISNTGNEDAGAFMVYFDGDESPVSSNRRPQVSHSLPGLTQGESISLEADFGPLAHPDNMNLANVYQISVLVDPKKIVAESNEENNSRVHAITPDVELYDRDDALIGANPAPLAGAGLPVLFVHGHNLQNSMDENFNYRKNWQEPLDYFTLFKLPSFKKALDLQQNSSLGFEPYYIRFQDQNRSIAEDAEEIGQAIERILLRHNDPQANQVKIVIIAYSKGTISTRWYLKNMMPESQPVSEFIAIASPNHGLSASNIQTGPSLAFRQLNNGYDADCNSFNEVQSNNFIELLNGHPIEDTETDSEQLPEYSSEAPGSRTSGTPVNEGVLYLSLYANNNRDAIGGGTSSGDCQGRLLAKNLAPDAVNVEVSEIAGVTSLGVHANTVHTPEVICLALYTAVNHQAPPSSLSCETVTVENREIPVIPLL